MGTTVRVVYEALIEAGAFEAKAPAKPDSKAQSED